MIFNNISEKFRVTKDLDIVLVVEKMSIEFGRAL